MNIVIASLPEIQFYQDFNFHILITHFHNCLYMIWWYILLVRLFTKKMKHIDIEVSVNFLTVLSVTKSFGVDRPKSVRWWEMGSRNYDTFLRLFILKGWRPLPGICFTFILPEAFWNYLPITCSWQFGFSFYQLPAYFWIKSNSPLKQYI